MPRSSKRLKELDTDLFMLSGTMIEPRDTNNPCVIVRNYGRDVANFAETRLLTELPELRKADWFGATWPPTLVSRRWWFMVGGYSSEFSPGMSSDNDFSMKLWHAGCRIFLGVGDWLVYHFQCKSTGKVVKNNGGKQFLHKWGMRQSVFDRYYLRRGQPARGLRLDEPEDNASCAGNCCAAGFNSRWAKLVPVIPAQAGNPVSQKLRNERSF